MAAARVTIDVLCEQVARIEANIGMQVSRLDAEIGTTVEANTTSLRKKKKKTIGKAFHSTEKK